MDTRLEKVKVLGMINISVLASGSIYLGQTIEPIKGANDPYKNLDMGIPFTKTPRALVFDYKAKISQDDKVTRATGSGVSKVDGRDREKPSFSCKKGGKMKKEICLPNGWPRPGNVTPNQRTVG